MGEDNRKKALEAFERCPILVGSDGKISSIQMLEHDKEVWLRSWELATQAAYERAEAKIRELGRVDRGKS